MKKHLIKVQKVKTIKSSKEYEQIGPESVQANPDCLAESQGMFVQAEPELSESVSKLVIRAKRELTPLQYMVFSLVTGLDGREPLTIRETGLKLNMSASRAQRIWEITRERLQEIYGR